MFYMQHCVPSNENLDGTKKIPVSSLKLTSLLSLLVFTSLHVYPHMTKSRHKIVVDFIPTQLVIKVTYKYKKVLNLFSKQQI